MAARENGKKGGPSSTKRGYCSGWFGMNDNVFCVVVQVSFPRSMEDEDTVTRDLSTDVEET